MYIEIENDYRTKISLSCKNMRLVLYKKTVQALDNPEYIRLLLNADTKMLAIQACRFRDPGAIYVRKLEGGTRFHSFPSKNLIVLIWKLCQWDDYSTYQITGTVHSGYNLVCFDLKQAVRRKDTFMLKKIAASNILIL